MTSYFHGQKWSSMRNITLSIKPDIHYKCHTLFCISLMYCCQSLRGWPSHGNRYYMENFVNCYICVTLLTYLLTYSFCPPPSLEQSNGWCVDAVSLSRRQNYAVSYVLRCSRKLSEQLDRRDSMRSPYQTNQYCWIRTLSNTSTSITKKEKVAHTRLPSLEFRSWSRFLAVSLQVMWVINPVVGCHYFPPGLQ